MARQPGLREQRGFSRSSIEKPVANSGYLGRCKLLQIKKSFVKNVENPRRNLIRWSFTVFTIYGGEELEVFATFSCYRS